MTSHYVLKIQYVNKPAETRNIGARVTTLGREAGDIVLGDPQSSGRHAEIIFENDQIRVKDLGSTNGTFFNGQRVPEFTMQPGQGFSIGQTVMTLMSIQSARQGAGKTMIAMGGVRPPGPPGAPPGAPPRPPGPPGPPQGFGAPPPGAPPQGFGAPPPGAPPQGFGAPPPGAPPQGFGAPPPQGPPPGGAFGAPPPQDPAPVGAFGAPPPGGAFGAPPPQGPPPGGFGGPPPQGPPGGGAFGGPPPQGPPPGGFGGPPPQGAFGPPPGQPYGAPPSNAMAPMGGGGMSIPAFGGPPMSMGGAPPNEIRGDFTGTGGELFGKMFVGALLTMITFGIYGFWFFCNFQNYIAEKTAFAPTEHGTLRFRFEGKGGQFFALCLVQGLLTAITFYIYMPWAICKFNKFFAENIVARADDGTEYRGRFDGTGGELFVTMLVQGLLTAITFYIYMPWAICKVRQWTTSRYKVLKNGNEVGGFDYDGTGGDLFVTGFVGVLLTAITFYIYLPWFIVKLKRFHLEHTTVNLEGRRYRGSFSGEGGELFVMGLVGGILMAITLYIYYFWFYAKLTKWELTNTVFRLEGGGMPAMQAPMGGGAMGGGFGQPGQIGMNAGYGQPPQGYGQPPQQGYGQPPQY